ncbi:hypothetical protein H5410_008216 [Solanum commersonii]|uniref:Uncharacterized protein n=1 Tax=Solanum commersonii TaxID=4109 RepID=A0A9J6AEA8_SOLCO|nr:hypothetical protein H5410_008216 [Solanum commersonii]
MTNPTRIDPIGRDISWFLITPRDLEDRATIQHDEHIARLTQEIEDFTQPPTYTTCYSSNPPLVNPQNQPPTHTPHVSLPTNTYPLPTTNYLYISAYTRGTYCHSLMCNMFLRISRWKLKPLPTQCGQVSTRVDQYEEMEKDVKAKVMMC